jgi:uncharacterized protein with NRDE domain
MCLVLFGWKAHPKYELILVANRDEFHQRPTAPADYWPDNDLILAGRDLQAGGTWMGVTRNGRFATVTNYREPGQPGPREERSRGELVRNFLEGGAAPLTAAHGLQAKSDRYRGFNLLLGCPGELAYLSNRDGEPALVEAGLHGLSNHLLNTEWPKVRAGRVALAACLQGEAIDSGALFSLMANDSPVAGCGPTGVDETLSPKGLARRFFIRSPVYGTRSTTVLLVGRNGKVTFEERSFEADGRPSGTSKFEFEVS